MADAMADDSQPVVPILTSHMIPKSRRRSRYYATSRLEAQSRRLEQNHDDIMADEKMYDNELTTLDEQYNTLVHRVGEAKVDAYNVSLLSSIEKERNKLANAKCAQITVANLREGLASYYQKRRRSGTEFVDLRRLGQTFGHYFNRVPSLEFMFGAIDRGVKKKRRRLRYNEAREEDDAPTTTPREVTSQDSKKIERLSTQRALDLNKLMKVQKIKVDKKQDLLDFLVCPKSFSETVENIFDFAHLVQRQSAQIKDLGDGNIVIGTASKKEASATKNENQIIFGLDMADWRALSAGREHGAIPFRGGAEQT